MRRGRKKVPPHVGHQAPAHEYLDEAGGLGGDENVAGEGEVDPGPRRHPVDGADDRFLQVHDAPHDAAIPLGCEAHPHRQVDVGAVVGSAEVGPGAEALARAGDDHRAYFVLQGQALEVVAQLLDHGEAERVLALRPVEGDHLHRSFAPVHNLVHRFPPYFNSP